MEKPIHHSLEELFLKADLSIEEKNIFLKHKKQTEYWLLRSKIWYSQPINSNNPNFIKRLARVLIKLNSDSVFGRKEKLVKDMFSDKSIHKFTEKENSGFRTKQISLKIENTYFELEIMSFFIDNDFKIELASSTLRSKKIPEFSAVLNNLRISIEAKQLDIEKILDNIFGDYFTMKFDETLTIQQRERGYQRIKERLEDNYNKAISKYSDLDDENLYLIFISTNYDLKFMGKYVQEFLVNLPKKWSSGEYEKLIGLVLVETESTIFISNPTMNTQVIEQINQLGIKNYHSYIPN